MAYSTFNSRKADYVARLGSHRVSSIKPEEVFDIVEDNDGKYEPVDAIMLEIRGSKIMKAGSLEKAVKEISKGNLQQEDKDVFIYARKNNIPIFITEPEMNKKDYARLWANLVAETPYMPFLSPYVSPDKNKKVPWFAKKLISNAMFPFQNHGGPGRNAVWARKLEEYIAPKLQEELGRKPRIGINVGLAHVGIEDDIKKPWRRNFTLKNWEKFNVGRYSGFNNGKNIGRIYKLTPKENEGWDIEKIDTDLFEEDRLKQDDVSAKRKNIEKYVGVLMILIGIFFLLDIPSISGFIINIEPRFFNSVSNFNFYIGFPLIILGLLIINLRI